jgi:quinol monooxygenase YgiN
MIRRYLLLGVSLVTSALIGGVPVDTLAHAPQRGPVVRLAELQIDPARLDEYKAALREEIEASIRLEPGVLTLYAVSVKGHPAQIRIFEMYADQAAYEAHLNTSHFVKYKTGTQDMVKSLVLVETDPILLRAKPR